jgi:hypothetical protein
MTNEEENEVYQNICFGNETIFFKVETPQCSANMPPPPKKKIDFGAGIGDMRKRFQTYEMLKNEESPFEETSFSISIDELLKVLEYLNELKIHYPQNCMSDSHFRFWNQFEMFDTPKLQRLLKHITEMRHVYDKYQSYDIPMIKRCIATPTKGEKEILSLMKQWFIIDEKDESNVWLQWNDMNLPPGKCVGVLFSMNNECKNENGKCGIEELEMNLYNKYKYLSKKIVKHPFMQSYIFNVCIEDISNN